ncbi:MAG: hypothetical protein WDA75_02535 [Candidatus Latescibacterota bacterium]|jgi:hypothetical protein
MRVRNIVGNVPEPDELYGRSDLIEHLWRQLDGNNILILAPRRFGKSGVMRHLLDRPRAGFIPVYLDLMAVDSPADYGVCLIGALLAQSQLRAVLHKAKGLPASLSRWISNTFDALEFEGARVELRGTIEPDWRDVVRRLVLELEKAEEKVLFLLDEFPVMLVNMADKHGSATAQEFMAWFSSVRLQGKDRLRRHRYVVAGSIGIDAILRRLDPPDKLRDFERLAVGAIGEADARRLAADLTKALDLEMPEALQETCLNLIGPRVPYFIHLLFSQLAQLRPEERHPVSEAVVRRVYVEQVLGPTCKHYFDHYRDRLARSGKPLERASLAMLRTVADAPLGRVSGSGLYDVYRKARRRGATETEFDELVANLECDWYLCLIPETNEYYFMVNVMRDWWRRWYGGARRERTTTEGR